MVSRIGHLSGEVSRFTVQSSEVGQKKLESIQFFGLTETMA